MGLWRCSAKPVVLTTACITAVFCMQLLLPIVPLDALFALWLDRIGAAHGVRAFAVDPGGIRTPLQRHLTMDEQQAMGWYDEAGTLNPLFKTTAEGAATSVWCATSPLLAGMGGVYCEDCNLGEMAGDPPPRASGVWPHVRDAALAAALWDKSEAMTGVVFNP